MKTEIPPPPTDDQMAAVASAMKRVCQYGIYTGRLETREALTYFNRCKRHVPTDPGSTLIFTRDDGMHSSGWWKNPDYSRCLHLSLSFQDRETSGLAPKHVALTEKWVEFFFGQWKRLIWAEPPFSEHGKKHDVWHYRVFTSPDFKVPLLPRGEVYSRELTEAGWKSWSDLHDGDRVESAHE
jgi:hypothetical protein